MPERREIIEFETEEGDEVRIEYGDFSKQLIKEGKKKSDGEVDFNTSKQQHGFKIYSHGEEKPSRMRTCLEFWNDEDYSPKQWDFIEREIKKITEGSRSGIDDLLMEFGVLIKAIRAMETDQRDLEEDEGGGITKL